MKRINSLLPAVCFFVLTGHAQVAIIENFDTCKTIAAVFPTQLDEKKSIKGLQPTYTITAASTRGTITPMGSVQVGQGASQRFTFAPDADCTFDSLLVNGVHVPDSTTSYTFNNVQADHSIRVVFTMRCQQHTIMARTGPNGYIAPAGDTIAPSGRAVQFIICPMLGYCIDKVIVDGVNRGALREYTVYAGGCHTIYATFARCQYTVVASTGTGGSIYPPGNSVVQHGGNITYTLVPNDNYHIGSVIVNDSNLGPLPVYTFTNVQANNTIQAIFAINTYGASTDATLSNLTLNTGTLSPAFNAATTIYTVNVANSVASITLTATKNHANATVTGDSVKSLSIGANFFSILVTAENGITTKTYTVVVNRAAAIGVSNDATLSNLAVSQGTLNPTFNADSISYSVAVPYSVASITLTATKNHANATVIGDSVKVLNIGANTFNIVVTAEDGTTKKTYTVVVTRESPATAVNAENVSTLKLYPNPVTNGELIVENEEWKAGEVIEMYNLSGALVGTRRVEEKNTSVNVANLPNGNYVLKVGRYSAKFVKQ